MAFFTHCEIRNFFFSRSGRKKNPPSLMTLLAAVKSETRIFWRLAWMKWRSGDRAWWVVQSVFLHSLRTRIGHGGLLWGDRAWRVVQSVFLHSLRKAGLKWRSGDRAWRVVQSVFLHSLRKAGLNEVIKIRKLLHVKSDKWSNFWTIVQIFFYENFTEFGGWLEMTSTLPFRGPWPIRRHDQHLNLQRSLTHMTTRPAPYLQRSLTHMTTWPAP